MNMTKSEELIDKVEKLLIELEEFLTGERNHEIRSIAFTLRGTNVGRKVQQIMRSRIRKRVDDKKNQPVEVDEIEKTIHPAPVHKRDVLKTMSLRQLKELARDVFEIPGKEVSRKKKDDVIQLILDKQSELDTIE